MERKRLTDVLLADGSTVQLRPVSPDDAQAVVAMHARFSDRTRYLRYFSPYPRIPARDLRRFVNVDHRDREALVVAVGEQLVAIGRYERLGPQAPDAEVAFVVEDAHQGRGIGSVLLEHLAAAAREAEIRRFVAEVLPANAAMMNVFTDAGYEVTRRYADGVVHLSFPVASTQRSRAVQWEREQRTEAASVARLLRPGAVAIYGASRSGRGVGASLLTHLREGGFAGAIHVVQRGEQAPAADLAMVAVPPRAVPAVVADAAAAGVHGLLVITDLDPAQRNDLVRQARDAGMRVIGPSSLGIADHTVNLNATLVPRLPARGRVGLFCQSGTLGLQLLAEADRRLMGISSFVSAGRRADVSGNDLLQFWAGDPETDVIAMYLETFGNPRKFTRIARTVGRLKPIVVLSSQSGAQATTGDTTGSLLDESAMQALRAQSGVIETGTVSEMFDVVGLLAGQPLPAGDRVGVVSNSFALTALAAARVRGAGLRVGRSGAVGAGAGPRELGRAVRSMLASDDADAVVVVVAPPLPTGPMSAHGEATLFAPFAGELAKHILGADKPVVVSFIAGPPAPELPCYPSAEEAVRALAHVVRRAAWLREPAGTLPPATPAPAPAPVGTERGASVAQLLQEYGVPVASSQRVTGTDRAVAAARELGFPVAVKVADRPHRIDLGAVRLNLPGPDAVRRAYAELEQLFGAAVAVVVQAMVAPGVACVIEAQDDPAFGPVVGFGLAGPVTELVGDRAWRPAPLTDRDALALARAPRAAALLADVDPGPLAGLLLRIGQLADEVPQLSRLILNPVLVRSDGWSVLHAEGTVGQPSALRPDTGPRELRGVAG